MLLTRRAKACDFTSQVTQNQTAVLPEITTYTCKDCGYSYTAETKPALGHTHKYGAPVADYTSGQAFVEGKDYTHTATCTGEGTCSQPTKTDKCTFNNGVETKAATCTEPGVKTFTCTECGGTYTVAIPATDHTGVSGSMMRALRVLMQSTAVYAPMTLLTRRPRPATSPLR